jgi:CheY-like chemotaxis protein
VPHTLLLADDSVTIQRVIELTFADENIDVVACSDGQGAIDAIDARRPDIVLADVGMPDPSGYDVARHIRDTPALSHIPVLLLTGAFEPVDPETARDLGCEGVLTKPFEPHVVVRRVRELLSTIAARAPEAARSASVLLPPPVAVRPVVSVPAPVPIELVTPAGLSPLDQYFEQLDQAITARAFSRPAPERKPAPVADHPTPDAAAEAIGGGLMADAFSALLADEESDAPDPAAAVRPLLAQAQARVDEAAIVERVVRRVLTELTDRVVRERVPEIVSQVAERLVLEEIERIKRNIT